MPADKKSTNQLKSIQPIHILRVSGMLLGASPIAAVFLENQVSLSYWIWMIFCCFFWPVLAFLRIKYSQDAINTERSNLMWDSFFISSFVPLVHFNLLPSVLASTVTISDKISSSARNVWFPSLFFMLAAIVLFGFFTGFKVDYPSSTTVILSCFPLLIVHSLTVSISTHRLVRNVRRKNKVLKQYSSIDFLTGLYNKGYWQNKAQALFEKTKAEQGDFVLALIDSDYFKEINDTFGHLIGDKVLSEIGKCILAVNTHECLAGRLGGDEFALVLKTDLAQARESIETLKYHINHISLPKLPALNCSISVGLAVQKESTEDLQVLFKQADKALYQAKNAGRNCIMG